MRLFPREHVERLERSVGPLRGEPRGVRGHQGGGEPLRKRAEGEYSSSWRRASAPFIWEMSDNSCCDACVAGGCASPSGE